MGQVPNGSPGKKIILLRPRGFCAGVVRAIDVVKIVLNLYGAPVYVRKEIVHNRHVVDELRQAGAIFVDELSEVPEGARVIFSAHGVSPAVREEAKQRHLQVIDATCPLVTKVHLEAVRFARQDYTIILIGHAGHDEVIGTLGEAPESTMLVSSVADVDRLEVKDPEKMSYLTQTTLSLDETKDIVARLHAAFSGHQRTENTGHLLRHGESPTGRKGRSTPYGSTASGRVTEQLEFPPTGGSL